MIVYQIIKIIIYHQNISIYCICIIIDIIKVNKKLLDTKSSLYKDHIKNIIPTDSNNKDTQITNKLMKELITHRWIQQVGLL